MKPFRMFNFNNSHMDIVFNYDEVRELPFPLNLSSTSKHLLSLVMILALLFGLKLRSQIFSYLRAPETKYGPMDHMIWIDQVNGLFLALVLLWRIVIVNLSMPLSQIMGDR